jgi:DUF4097 and DUF4098 domain-containing protein YvlB
MVAGAVVAGVWLTGASAIAQTSDADWLAQCREQRDSQVRHCEVRPVNLAWGGLVHVDARPNGGVQITGGNQSAVVGSARIQVQAGTEADAQAMASGIIIETSTGALRANGPKMGEGRSWSVSFVLSTPHRTDVQIEAVNGPVAITGVVGKIQATTTNGPMSLRELGGDVQVRTTNGPLSIVLGGTSWEGVGLDAATQNGPLKIAVPDGYSAQLETRTVNGPFSIGIPITVQGDLPIGRTKSINAPIGAGGAPIRAVTTNGPVTIDKR